MIHIEIKDNTKLMHPSIMLEKRMDEKYFTNAKRDNDKEKKYRYKLSMVKEKKA